MANFKLIMMMMHQVGFACKVGQVCDSVDANTTVFECSAEELHTDSGENENEDGTDKANVCHGWKYREEVLYQLGHLWKG